jgi:uncharacterized OsmC-like protein
MIQYPLSFKVSSSANSGIQHPWTSTFTPSGEEPVISLVAIPREFEGPGGGYSPEDFYALALVNCFVATFKVFAEKSNLIFSDLECEAALVVDRDEKGIPWMSSFHLKGILSGTVDPERTRRILDKTSQACMILNSVKTVKTFEWVFQD